MDGKTSAFGWKNESGLNLATLSWDYDKILTSADVKIGESSAVKNIVVTGKTTTQELTVSGSIESSFSSDVKIDGKVTMNAGDLKVITGHTTLHTLTTNSTAVMNGDLTVTGTDTQIHANSLLVNNSTTLSGNLTVALDATVQRDLTVSGRLTVEGTTTTVNSENLDIKDRIVSFNVSENATNGYTMETASNVGVGNRHGGIHLYGPQGKGNVEMSYVVHTDPSKESEVQLLRFANAGIADNTYKPENTLATGFCNFIAKDIFATSVSCSSDISLKEDIVYGLDVERQKLHDLQPCSFKWIQDTSGTKDKSVQYGFIAQEVQQVFPDLVGVRSDNTLTIQYIGIIGMLVAEVKALRTEVDALKNK